MYLPLDKRGFKVYICGAMETQSISFLPKLNINLNNLKMNNLPNLPVVTAEQFWAQHYENERFLTEKFAENERLMKENDRIFREEIAETRRVFKEQSADFDKRMKEIQQTVGGMGNSNGDVAETYFRNCFAKSMTFAGQEFDHIDAPLGRKNKRLNLQAEYDIVMYNCTSVAIIEIKYKVEKEVVGRTLKKVEIFKKLFPQYQGYAIYLGLAGLSIEASAEKEAILQGIAVIKQVGDTVVIYDEHLKVF